MFARIAPALVLFFLSPFVGELLHGDLTLNGLLVAFLLLALLYGGGAVFIRELARRTGRGWPTILTLAAAYGLLEEAFVTQSLFNPNYLGLRLLDYGFIPALGISPVRTIYLLTLHVVWSIGVPIALTEALFWKRRTTPWLRGFGFSISGILFVLGMLMGAATTLYQSHYMASAGQFTISAVIIVALIIVAFAVFRRASMPSMKRLDGTAIEASAHAFAPPPWFLGVVAEIGGAAFVFLTYNSAPTPAWSIAASVPAVVAVPVMLVLEVAVTMLVIRAAHSPGWSAAHWFALAAGGLLVYCWEGFLTTARLHGVTNFPLQVVWVVLAVALLVFTGSRLRYLIVQVG